VENLIAIKAGRRDELPDYGHKKGKETLDFSAVVVISSPASPSANSDIRPTSLSSALLFIVTVDFAYIFEHRGWWADKIATTTKKLLIVYSYPYSIEQGSQTEHLPWVGGKEPRR
jgi:hypothetical protein